jgi:serine/threonine-protein kinase
MSSGGENPLRQPATDAPTVSTPEQTKSAARRHQQQFLPGTVLNKRYRIIELLGRGGMGEVYRADDIELGVPVALKFLPPAVASDPAALNRLRAEVRVARQVSHYNVCRVYDIGEIDGQHFLSMEYIDGENLQCLLSRIGRPADEKALQIARQLCAGLAAAHQVGVLHRDLKPANIMIDGRGQARISDFGLAGLREELEGGDARGGTPAYMAPEQFRGDVSVQSDIYALGLVLYELFTGQSAFQCDSAEQFRQQHETQLPSAPSGINNSIAAPIDELILHCLEKEPRRRPASALAMAARLPGGNVLEAALAAGETPSPRMVADAGETGELSAAVIVVGVAAVVVGIIGTAWFADQSSLLKIIPFDKPPPVLLDRARQVCDRLGYTADPRDEAYLLRGNRQYLQHIASHHDARSRRELLSTGCPPAAYYWYRSSPQEMVPLHPARVVVADDPPFTEPGAVRLAIDTCGRLLYFEAQPPARVDPRTDNPKTDWSVLLAEAGLDPTLLRAAELVWRPAVWCDERIAWAGTYPEQPDSEIRVEAAAALGRPVYFRILHSWETDDPASTGYAVQRNTTTALSVILAALFVLFCCAYVAWRNYVAGRGDRRGATRFAMYVFFVLMCIDLLLSHHVSGADEFLILMPALSENALVAVLMFLFYIAVEPFARRYWPQSLVSWSRVLSGRLRDPLVGRDLLLGCIAGVALVFVHTLCKTLPERIGAQVPVPLEHVSLAVLSDTQDAIGFVLIGIGLAPFFGAAGYAATLLLRVLVRRPWVAYSVIWLLCAVMGTRAFSLHPALWCLALLGPAVGLLLLARVGLLGLLAMLSAGFLTATFPTTLDFSAWYAGLGMFGPVAVLLLALYGAQLSRRRSENRSDPFQEHRTA